MCVCSLAIVCVMEKRQIYCVCVTGQIMDGVLQGVCVCVCVCVCGIVVFIWESSFGCNDNLMRVYLRKWQLVWFYDFFDTICAIEGTELNGIEQNSDC